MGKRLWIVVGVLMVLSLAALADTGEGEVGRISVEAGCEHGEPARIISVTNLHPSSAISFLVESWDNGEVFGRRVDDIPAGETRRLAVKASEWDNNSWVLNAFPDGDLAFQAEVNSPSGTDCAGKGSLASIDVAPACLEGESARTVTAFHYNDTGLGEAGFAIESFGTGESYSVGAFYLEPGESMSFTIPVSTWDEDEWSLFTDPDGDQAHHVTTTGSAGEQCADSFTDDDDSAFEADIEAIAASGITKGCNPPENDLFCPEDNVTREQMAAFVVRALGLTDSDHPGFTDVPAGSTFDTDIKKLAKAGITRGCNPPANDRFCPEDEVSREQMAAFMVRALGLIDNDHPGFADVSDGSTFDTDIKKLAKAGITRGCNPPANDRYCPKDNVTREQMAAFMNRAGWGG